MKRALSMSGIIPQDAGVLSLVFYLELLNLQSSFISEELKISLQRILAKKGKVK